MSRPERVTVQGESYLRIDLAAMKIGRSLPAFRVYLQHDFAGDRLRTVKVGTTYVNEGDLAAFRTPARGNPQRKLYRFSSKWKARRNRKKR